MKVLILCCFFNIALIAEDQLIRIRPEQDYQELVQEYNLLLEEYNSLVRLYNQLGQEKINIENEVILLNFQKKEMEMKYEKLLEEYQDSKNSLAIIEGLYRNLAEAYDLALAHNHS